MSRSSVRPAKRVYNRRIIIASVVYAAMLLPTTYIVRHYTPELPLRIVLGLLPALGIVAMFVALGRYLLEETDEYLRACMVNQILWATGGTLSLATMWGFLENFDAAPHLPLYVVAIVWFFCLGLVGALTRDRAA
ncbi:hypothetical protein [Glacieibacterium frigidum]|uniref:Transmembrane protein n=1 Tax=Glacieibacterium frigidum TaxID=2593303 RepID=A0A552UFE9_9SPHN|nr:hypothetical protein [Glacieibacterium frigidum]TRW16924.1 hypothetical protein FMM06_01570 [Glacieibacterium frigidum]